MNLAQMISRIITSIGLLLSRCWCFVVVAVMVILLELYLFPIDPELLFAGWSRFDPGLVPILVPPATASFPSSALPTTQLQL